MEGKAERMRRDILRLGTMRFGMPSRETRETISEISDLTHLKVLLDRVITASSWNELLGN